MNPLLFLYTFSAVEKRSAGIAACAERPLSRASLHSATDLPAEQMIPAPVMTILFFIHSNWFMPQYNTLRSASVAGSPDRSSANSSSHFQPVHGWSCPWQKSFSHPG